MIGAADDGVNSNKSKRSDKIFISEQQNGQVSDESSIKAQKIQTKPSVGY
jgi:hypothetical protein